MPCEALLLAHALAGGDALLGYLERFARRIIDK